MTVRNWNATTSCDPALEATPASLDELVAIVKDRGRCPSPVRAAGSLHSLNPCAMTDGTLVHMKVAPFREIGPPANGAVTVGAGVTMFELKNELKQELQDIHQSVRTRFSHL